MAQRYRLFREGAESFRQVMIQFGNTHLLADIKDMYLCPLCLGPFPIEAIEDGRLTIEHVPPESLGGAELLLTCAACNHTAGTAFDAEAGKIERLRSFYGGNHDGPVRAKFAVNGAAANGEMHIAGVGQLGRSTNSEISIESQSGGGIYFEAVLKVNNPTNVEQFKDALEGVRKEPLVISFTPNLRASPALANISWIRAAYLAAFAVFGWRYALRPVFEPISIELQKGRGAELPELYRYDGTADPQRREIVLVLEHADCPCVVVAIGQHIVFLPAIGRTTSLVDLAAAVKIAESNGGTFNGELIPWPESPEYRLDRLADQTLRSGGV